MKSKSYSNMIPSLVFSSPPKKEKTIQKQIAPLWLKTHSQIHSYDLEKSSRHPTTTNCLYLLLTETFMVLDCSSREGGESLNIILYFNRSHSYREISFPEDDSQGNIADYGATSMTFFIIKEYQPVSLFHFYLWVGIFLSFADIFPTQLAWNGLTHRNKSYLYNWEFKFHFFKSV